MATQFDAATESFLAAMSGEDDLGVVIRAHIYIEQS
jgi:hypothetical protein